MAASSRPTLYINGKFASQRTTGVQRVARQLIGALDRCLLSATNAGLGDVVLLVPPGAHPPPMQHIRTEVLGRRPMSLALWEQFRLPWAARHGWLLNLSGSSPLLGHHQSCLIHDAAVFDRPLAYSRAFRLWYRALFWLLPRLGAQLLTVSAFSRQRLAAVLGMPEASIGVVPNGAEHLADIVPDAAVLARLGLVAGRFFLAVGSVNANKNLAALQAAFTALPPDHGCQLVLVGDSHPRVFGAQSSPRAADEPHVLRTGPVNDAALKALYQHALALVFPSLYEGFGLPPLEAMACGCPVAASSAAAIPEVCGDAALYFDPASIEQISVAMERLRTDEALRLQLRHAGLARAASFQWDQAARTLAQLLILGRSRSPASS
jgi:glycosyltransferase involved in cell wall biosynthesis